MPTIKKQVKVGAMGKGLETSLPSIIGLIYRAATEPEVWLQVAQQIETLMRSSTVNLWSADFSDNRLGVSVATGHTQDVLDFYEREILSIDKAAHLLVTGSANTMHAMPALFGSEEAWRESEGFQRHYENQGMQHTIGVQYLFEAGSSAIFSMGRTEREGAYNPQEIAFLGQLLPHLRQSFEIRRQLIDAHAKDRLSLLALDNVASGVAIFDENHRLVLNNSQCERLVANGLLRKRANELVFADNQTQQILYQTINALNTNQDNSSFLIQQDDAAVYICHVLPIWISDDNLDLMRAHSRFHYALFIIDSSLSGSFPADILQKLYQLTGVEVAVLELLVSGLSIKEISERRSVGYEAVRFHIKSLLRKTQCKRQAELVAKVLRLSVGV